MSGYEVLIFVLAVLVAVVGAAAYLRSGGAFAELGRQGGLWFEHPDEREISDRPSEDEIDAPIPRRPLRGRMAH